MNIRFSYLYRDGANYKSHNEVIFSNPEKKSLEEIEQVIKANLIDETWFVAKHWNIPDMHFKEYTWDSDLDHNWHEFDSAEETEEMATEEISIEDFIDQIEKKKVE